MSTNGLKEHWPPAPPFPPEQGKGMLFEPSAVLHERGGPAVALTESMLVAAFYAATLRMSPAEFAELAKTTLEGALKTDVGALPVLTRHLEDYCGERFLFDEPPAENTEPKQTTDATTELKSDETASLEDATSATNGQIEPPIEAVLQRYEQVNTPESKEEPAREPKTLACRRFSDRPRCAACGGKRRTFGVKIDGKFVYRKCYTK